MNDNEEVSYYVEDLYKDILCKNKLEIFGDRSFPSAEDLLDSEIIDLENNIIHITLSVGGNYSTESGDNPWGYGYTFSISLEDELFVGYYVENYS